MGTHSVFHFLSVHWSSILGVLGFAISVINLLNWYIVRRTNLSFTLTLDHLNGPSAKIQNLGSTPVLIKSVKFEVLDKDASEITINHAIAPGEDPLLYVMPRDLVGRVVLTNDVALQITYGSNERQLRKSRVKLFNFVGGDGRIVKIKEGASYLSFADCKKCQGNFAFSTKGMLDGKFLERKRKKVEKQLFATCPEHAFDRE